MKQVLQSIDSGELLLESVPPPALLDGGVRVRTAASLISAGTERMLVELAQKSLVGKAQARPDLVRQVLAKVKKEGLVNTYRNVRAKMERPMPLGYSAAGVVEGVGASVSDLHVGDRVAIAGAGYAAHAEVNFVPKNLVALIPDGVSFDDAAYTTVASIALQGVRLARPELGDNVVVLGLGLIGLITVQLLKANGCRVFGIDVAPRKVELGLSLGMDAGAASATTDVLQAASRFTRGRGADHVLITAATKSNEPVELAGEIARMRGQVVAVGAVGMQIPRDVYYKKELELKISMSYGPGRYDPSYEEGGVDYPYPYVRWTEQRNMEAVLELMAQGRLNVKSLTTHRFSFESALEAYDLIRRDAEPYVGIMLDYDLQKPQESRVDLNGKSAPASARETLGVGFVGAGNYAALHLIPHLARSERVQLRGLVTATGLNARQKAEKHGFAYCATDIDALLMDDSVDAICIATRHSTHAHYAIRALEAGKHVFVEKPVVVNEDELEALVEAYESAQRKRATALLVGLNRRFAPMVEQLVAAFTASGPKQMVYRVNSGHIPTSAWLYEAQEGGGMMVGEMCHFVDLMQFIAGSPPTTVSARSMALDRDDVADRDNVILTLTFADGSVGTLAYNTIGDKAASKERLEVYGGGTVAILDDFRSLEIIRNGKSRRSKSLNQDKGQSRQVEQMIESFRLHGTSPIPFDEIVAGMRAIFAARRSLLDCAIVPIAAA